ncbi:MAG: GTPase, partial [Candidatus Eremiobacterota bacterium]
MAKTHELNPDQSDTIVAVATPPGEGAVAIVRLSGPACRSILEGIFHPVAGRVSWQSHRMVLGWVKGERPLDQALAVWMQAPYTYTRDDVVEFHLHGSPALARAVVDLCLERGARLARPGEFTLRAFLNGRLDLAQAESVMQLVAARTQAQLEQAAGSLGGLFSAQVESLRGQLLDWLAQLEAELDFGDEVAPMEATEAERRLETLTRQAEALIRGAETGRLQAEGARVALVGPPNAGKSTLLNRILEEE